MLTLLFVINTHITVHVSAMNCRRVGHFEMAAQVVLSTSCSVISPTMG